MRILITSGGTREPIDSVRYISNFSTGSTGAYISHFLTERGMNVTLVHAKDALKPELFKGKMIPFITSNDLDLILQKELQETSYDYIIHMAAISDFLVETVNGEIVDGAGKINSENDLKLTFKKNKKLLPSLKSYSRNKETILIAFKLTSQATKEMIHQKIFRLIENGADFIIHNDLQKIDEKMHATSIYNQKGLVETGKTKAELGSLIEKIVNKELV